MPINATRKYQGYVMATIAEELSKVPNVHLTIRSGKDRSAFLLDCSDGTLHCSLGIYIKTSSKRRSPWRYTFLKAHQEAIEVLNGLCHETFVVFVNEDDGVAVIHYDQLKELLDHEFEDAEWVSVSRKHNQSYKLNGKDGELKGKQSATSFPEAIVAAVEYHFVTTMS